MINQPAKRQIDKAMEYTYLSSLWYVDADESYSIVKPPASIQTDEAELVAVRTLRGKGILVQKGGKRHELVENNVGIFRYRDIRRYGACPQGWQFYWFRFRCENWQHGVNHVIYTPLRLEEKKDMERCFMGLSSTDPWQCLHAEALFHCLLSGWMMRREDSTGHGVYAGTITGLLEKGWMQRISIVQLAREAGMSERSFRDAVRRITGRGPKEYMLKRRMETAMELLQTTTLSVAQVSAQLGYDNPFYFSRTFKDCFGICPKQVRRRKISPQID